MNRATWVLSGVVLCLTPTLLSAQPSGDRLTTELYLEWEDVRPFLLAGGMGPQISPDGSQILYNRKHVDKMKDRWVGELWVMDREGSRNRFLTEGGGAVWSPSGDRIAFVRATEGGGAEIFVRWMDDEAATTQISRLEQGPGGLAWSPDGRHLAFSMMVASEAGMDGSPYRVGPKEPNGPTRPRS